jgi:hypothetical protein
MLNIKCLAGNGGACCEVPLPRLKKKKINPTKRVINITSHQLPLTRLTSSLHHKVKASLGLVDCLDHGNHYLGLSVG